jgi:predicted dehydrogenase
MPKKLSIAVVGCGYWGPNLMRNFSESSSFQLKWLVDLNPNRLKHFSSHYPQTKCTRDFKTALADPELDAVAIATPVSTHFQLAKQALQAGKHVLLEKPMAQTTKECDELIELAKKRKLTLMIDHTFVYSGAVRMMKQIIDRGELGEIYYFDSVRVNLGLFQHDVNVIWDLAPHDLSIMDYVMKEKPIQLSAHAACHVPGNRMENIAYLTLKFPKDYLAHFHVNWMAPAKVRRIIIGGSKRMLVFDDLNPDEKIKIYDRGVMIKNGGEKARQLLAEYRMGDLHVPHLDRTEPLKHEIQHFGDCIQKKKQPMSDGCSGSRIVTMLTAAQKSLNKKGAFVDL